jgi:hypothetical protein
VSAWYELRAAAEKAGSTRATQILLENYRLRESVGGGCRASADWRAASRCVKVPSERERKSFQLLTCDIVEDINVAGGMLRCT